MTAREFPSRPLVGVGAVIIHGEGDEVRVLLARRGRAPSLGEWSIPGGLVKVGETLEQAVIREVAEETGLRVQVVALAELLDRIIFEQEENPKENSTDTPTDTNDSRSAAPAENLPPAASSAGRVKYHYVIADYLCRLEPTCLPDSARPSSDATELAWCLPGELARFKLRPQLERILKRCFAESTGPG